MIPLLLVAAVSMTHRALGKDLAAWRFDLKFDSICGAEFSVAGSMLFNGKGKKSGRIFAGIVHQPFLYAELEDTPDLRTSKITIRLEVMSELENVMYSPKEILRFQISLIHLRETHKFQLNNIVRLKNDTPDYTRMSVEFDVDLAWFKRMEKSDCFYDKVIQTARFFFFFIAKQNRWIFSYPLVAFLSVYCELRSICLLFLL